MPKVAVAVAWYVTQSGAGQVSSDVFAGCGDIKDGALLVVVVSGTKAEALSEGWGESNPEDSEDRARWPNALVGRWRVPDGPG